MSLLEQEKEGAKSKRLRQEDLGRRRKRTHRQKACMPERVHSGYQTPINVKNYSHRERSAEAQMLVLFNILSLGKGNKKGNVLVSSGGV